MTELRNVSWSCPAAVALTEAPQPVNMEGVATPSPSPMLAAILSAARGQSGVVLGLAGEEEGEEPL